MFGLSWVAALFGVLIFAASQSAIHEIEAFILFLIWAVLFSAHFVHKAVLQVNKTLKDMAPKEEPKSQEALENEKYWARFGIKPK